LTCIPFLYRIVLSIKDEDSGTLFSTVVSISSSQGRHTTTLDDITISIRNLSPVLFGIPVFQFQNIKNVQRPLKKSPICESHGSGTGAGGFGFPGFQLSEYAALDAIAPMNKTNATKRLFIFPPIGSRKGNKNAIRVANAKLLENTDLKEGFRALEIVDKNYAKEITDSDLKCCIASSCCTFHGV
jgi:hypothetical protein